MDFLEKHALIEDEHNALLEKERKILETREWLSSYFLRKWRSLDTNSAYKVYAFAINDMGEYPYVGVLAERDGCKSAYYYKGHYKKFFLDAFSDKIHLESDGFVILTIKELSVVLLPNQAPFIDFTTNGLVNFNGHSYAEVDKFVCHTPSLRDNAQAYRQTEVDAVNNTLMGEIKCKVKVQKCHKLEELPEGIELVIKAIKQVEYRRKVRYILAFENLGAMFLSNHWLEEELGSGAIDLRRKIKLKLDVLKHTPSRNKERVVFCTL